MIDLIMGQLAPYLMAAIGLIAAYFGIKSKVQSSKIEKQGEAIKVQAVNEVLLKQSVATQKEVIKQVIKANEILNSNDAIDDVAKRLRERARARGNSNKK
jgi:adenine deaminase